MSTSYEIFFRGESKNLTQEECRQIGIDLVRDFKSGSERQKNKALADLLDLVMGMTYNLQSIVPTQDRADFAQELRMAVLAAIETFEESFDSSFQTYLSYKFQAAYNSWRYYQAQLVRTKDNRFNRKTKALSLDTPISSRAGNPSGSSDQTYKDLVCQDNSEHEYKEVFPRLEKVMSRAHAILSPKQLKIFQAYIASDGNMTRASELVGFSHQYLAQEVPRIFKLISKGFHAKV